MESKKIFKKEKDKNAWKYRKFFWRSWSIQASWNYERQMNMGFLYGISPILDEIYKDPKDAELKKDAYKRHLRFYNCTPQTSAFVLGLSAAMEEQYYEHRENIDPESINAMKTSLMGPLSGVGDSFFQGTIRILAFGLGINLAQQGSIAGPILAILISFIPSYFVTYYGGKIGYLMGNKYLSKLYNEGLMEKVMYVCSIVGLMVIGSMMASMIGITTPITFNKFILQDVLDGIVPQIIPLGITFLMYWLLRKKVKTGWMLTICIASGLLFSALGIFA
ncbi:MULTISPECIES: PTS system mannose/fructose/sorbose family transporter subunit IID [unclassified Clostridioides]|uniref:PTS system mannose/fructose/sorbose family transporter subunit IID n=1 Tax=unclassified Clostridioides TaxID=2635829 RepID=UPI001D11AC44|nr:PTS system mannose/fructose/sorbose family transporter subunit IID [Clostridioides sp. ES-S-0171-01]MCC0689822.1 PTS system mannose/fructose/sorbose family transporter subunit IID [Clostridioides sp. ES-S-0056-01]MCC0715663.1 PTS system mannose/fructose/sorbose family transporter subunit IID [Clostridioides sp. ES-S-0077-01]UDN54465.1 PTS system mannose/fructose/sorbose family transporter subunit IID [Clostridioides sp. ES-S-0054-01]